MRGPRLTVGDSPLLRRPSLTFHPGREFLIGYNCIKGHWGTLARVKSLRRRASRSRWRAVICRKQPGKRISRRRRDRCQESPPRRSRPWPAPSKNSHASRQAAGGAAQAARTIRAELLWRPLTSHAPRSTGRRPPARQELPRPCPGLFRVNHGFKVRSGPEFGYRGLRYLDCRAGSRITRSAGRPDLLFEYPES